MKLNNTKRLIRTLVIAAIVILVVAIAIGKITVHKHKEYIRTEYTKIVDAKIEEYLSAADDNKIYEKNEYGLTKIGYEITDIDKDDFLYVITLKIDIECEDDSETGKSLLAYEVEEECFELARSGSFEIGKFKCSYSAWHPGPYGHDKQIFTYVNGEKIHGPTVPIISKDEPSNDDTVCGSCKREFSEGGSDAKSIRRTGMCSNCYSNFKSMTGN